MSDYSDVIEFRRKFELPVPHRDVRPLWLNEAQFEFRRQAMVEEIWEYSAAYHKEDLVSAVDGLIDIVYFALGTSIEMRVPESIDPPTALSGYTEVRRMGYDAVTIPRLLSTALHEGFMIRVSADVSVLQAAYNNQSSDSLLMAIESLRALARHCYQASALMGIPWRACWPVVHKANMKKVWGSSHRSSRDIVKPDGWEAPEPQLRKILGV